MNAQKLGEALIMFNQKMVDDKDENDVSKAYTTLCFLFHEAGLTMIERHVVEMGELARVAADLSKKVSRIQERT